MPQAAPPLEYQSRLDPPPRPPRPNGPAQFFIALILGCALSAIVYYFGWEFINEGRGMFLVWGIPLLKLCTGLALVFQYRWRPAGAGILTSLPIGFLIFFSVCAASFKI